MDPISLRPLRAGARGAAVLALLACGSTAFAQVVNPADKQAAPQATPQDVPTFGGLAETLVTAKQVSEYREEDLIGPYGQPVWTAYRRFPTTRVYVRPPGTFAFEYWTRLTFPENGSTELQTQYEFEIGLPGRFQFDLYIVREQEGHEGNGEFSEQKFEIRYALADWGVIWGNPTLYFEIVNKDDAPDVLEYKLLLGDEISPGWHWGTNLVFEHETGGSLENVYELTAGVSRILEDNRFSLGGELKYELVDVHGDRGNYDEELLLGPSLQYRPTSNVHIDLAGLVGLTEDAPEGQVFFVLGYDF